jgi:CheY-like chemotaxis protein
MTGGVEVHVLVADDNDGIRESTAAILRSVGYTDTEADQIRLTRLMSGG